MEKVICVPKNQTLEDFLAAAAGNLEKIAANLDEKNENYLLLRAAYTQVTMVRNAFLTKQEEITRND